MITYKFKVEFKQFPWIDFFSENIYWNIVLLDLNGRPSHELFGARIEDIWKQFFRETPEPQKLMKLKFKLMELNYN